MNVDFKVSEQVSPQPAPTIANSDESGTFYFFQSNSTEMLVKVLNGCSFNNRYWVFSSAVTNVEFNITVEDTKTRTVKTYFNPLGKPAPPVQDTSAFATCS